MGAHELGPALRRLQPEADRADLPGAVYLVGKNTVCLRLIIFSFPSGSLVTRVPAHSTRQPFLTLERPTVNQMLFSMLGLPLRKGSWDLCKEGSYQRCSEEHHDLPCGVTSGGAGSGLS